jgi:hypothetical protein
LEGLDDVRERVPLVLRDEDVDDGHNVRMMHLRPGAARTVREVSGQGRLLEAAQGVCLAVKLGGRPKERCLGAEDAAALAALRVVEGQERVVLPDLIGQRIGCVSSC